MATSRHLISSALPMIAFALVASCTIEAPGETAKAAQVEDASAVRLREAPRVRTEAVIRKDMLRILETTGAVESVSEIDVVAEATGRIIGLYFEEGDVVRKGDLLASIERLDQELSLADSVVALSESMAALDRSELAEKEADARIRTADLQLEQAEQDHERNLQLTSGEKSSPLSAQALEAGRIARDSAIENLNQFQLAAERSKIDTKSALSAVERSQLAKSRAERTLERCDLRSPIDGVIASRTAELGANLAMGAPAFHIVAPDELRVIFYRPQREMEIFLSDGSITLEAEAEAHPGFRFPGQILRTSPTIDRTSGAFRVTASLSPVSEPNQAGETGRLLPGMLLRMFIVTGRHEDALVVPKRAVRREGAETFVLVADEGLVRRVTVFEEYSDELNVEVTPTEENPLSAGELVVTVGSRELKDGAEVSIDSEGEQGAEEERLTTAKEAAE